MADELENNELNDNNPDFKPPAEKSMREILEADAEDESLKKYKALLLGESVNSGGATVIDDSDPRRVIPKSLVLRVAGRNDVELDLTGDLTTLKTKPFRIKEGCSYRLEVNFWVQREIVSGLRYVHTTYRQGVKVDQDGWMIGSYGPKRDLQSYVTPTETAPSGVVACGEYTVKSSFIDDDKIEHLQWEWCFKIRRDWD